MGASVLFFLTAMQGAQKINGGATNRCELPFVAASGSTNVVAAVVLPQRQRGLVFLKV